MILFFGFLTLPGSLNHSIFSQIDSSMQRSIQVLSEPSSISKSLRSMFLHYRSTPNMLIHLILIIQISSLIMLCDRNILNYIYNASLTLQSGSFINTTPFMLSQVLIIIFIQLYFGVSFIKISYLKCLFGVETSDPWRYLIILLTSLGLIIDFIKTSTSLIYFRSKWCEPLNQLKLMTHLINLSAVVSVEFQLKLAYPINLGLYLILYGLRLKFPMTQKSSNLYSEILILFGISLMLFLSIQDYFYQVSFYYQLLGITAIFSFHFTLKEQFFKQKFRDVLSSMDDFIDNSSFITIVEKLIVYFQELVFVQNQSNRLQEHFNYIAKTGLPPLNHKTRALYLQQLYSIFLGQKESYKQSLHYSTVLAQLSVLSNRGIGNLLQIYQQARSKSIQGVRSWIVSIQLNKVQQFVKYTIRNEIEDIKKRHRQQSGTLGINCYLQNFYFVENMVLAAKCYSELWIHLWQGVQLRTQLNRKLDKLLIITKQTQQAYNTIPTKSKYSSLLYCNYLKLIHMNKQRKRVVEMDWELYKQVPQDCMVYAQTVFISIRMSGEILRIGENSLGLLGFSHEEISHSNISRLMPGFQQGQGNEWIKRYLENISQKKSKADQILPCFLVDQNDNLKFVKFDLDIYFVNDELILAGSCQVDKSINHIIAFDKSGKIVMTSNFMGKIYTNDIHSQKQIPIEELINELEKGSVVELTINVSYASITNNYKLREVILQEKANNIIYIIANVPQQYAPETVKTFFTGQKSILQSKQTRKEEEDKIQKSKDQYQEKYKPSKLLYRFLILFSFSTVLLIITIFFSTVVDARAFQKSNISRMMKQAKISGLKSVYFVGMTYYLDLQENHGMTLPSFGPAQMQELRQQISVTKKSIKLFNEINHHLQVNEVFQNSVMKAKGTLLAASIIVNLDMMLIERQPEHTQNYLDLVKYTQRNIHTFVGQLLPGYEVEILTELLGKIQFYRRSYLMTLILTILFTVLQAVAHIVFDKVHKLEMLGVDNAIIQLDVSELKRKLDCVAKFQRMIYCVQKTERSRWSSSPLQEFKQQRKEEKRLASISDEIPPTSEQFAGSMSPIPSFTPIAPSINDSTAHHLITSTKPIEPIEYEAKKPKEVKKMNNTSRSCLLILITIILAACLCTNQGLYYQFSKTPQYPSYQYLKSLISLSNTFFSYQSLHSYLFQNIYSNFTHMGELKEALANFSTSTHKLKEYDFTLFSPEEFKQFRQFKNKLDFQFICKYIQCEHYLERLNATYMTNVVNDARTIELIYNASTVTTIPLDRLVSDYGLDYLVYSSRIYLEILVKLYNFGFEGLQMHFRVIKNASYIRIAIQYGLIGLEFIINLALFLRLLKEARRVIELMRLLREDKDTDLQF